MPKQLIVDGKPIEVEDGITLLQACEAAGAEIPRFCYHERLSIAGNCRMCLVEVEGMGKPQASCAIGVNDLPPNKDGSAKKISTLSPMVRQAREGVMEFLLVNHPLDCPICDQGGECDLQDQAMGYGKGGSRFAENKRAVEEKYLGSLVKTVMTRCIQCTRCVRFMAEVAGVEEMGAIGRGEDMEITSFLERGLTSELSANIIDLCPVGALTSGPTAFHARSWELKKTESIDVMDAVGCNVRIDTRGREVVRILPRNHDDVNEEWISDKSRYIADGLKTQRLDQPYVRQGDRLVPVDWNEALSVVAGKLKAVSGRRIAAIAGDHASAEEMFALKQLFMGLGSPNIDCRQDGALLDAKAGRAGYLFNSTIAGIDEADAMLLIGTNPREEAAVLNARIRKRWRSGGLRIGLIGRKVDLTYTYEYLGAGPRTLSDVAEGRHAFAEALNTARRPMIIIGQGALRRGDGPLVLSLAARIAQAAGARDGKDGWNGFNVLHTAASRVAGLDLGFVPGEGGLDMAGMLREAQKGAVEVVYLLGADEFDMKRLGSAFVIYQGSHGDAGAHRADVILPGSTYTEKSGTYVNTEGRAQLTQKAGFAPGLAKDDWAIIRAVSGALAAPLPYDNLPALRAAMYKGAPHLAAIDRVAPAATGLAALTARGGSIVDEPFGAAIEDYFLCHPIARASAVMAELSALKAARQSGKTGATGTHG